MGSDDLFHKRKVKTPKHLRRKQARREPYAKVLIVCEGQKTEPNYFSGLRDDYKINTTNIEICGDCGSDPVSIYRYAKKGLERNGIKVTPLTRCFVFSIKTRM